MWSYARPQRVRQFLWLVFKERLLTNAERCRRGMPNSSSCKLCGCVNESILHSLTGCRKVRDIWEQVIPLRLMHRIPLRLMHRFFSYSLKDWLRVNLGNVFGLVFYELDWRSLFGILYWKIWKERCSYVFQDVQFSKDSILHSS